MGLLKCVSKYTPEIRVFEALELELKLELVQSNMTQKPMLRGEVGACALLNPEGRGKGRKVVYSSELAEAS